MRDNINCEFDEETIKKLKEIGFIKTHCDNQYCYGNDHYEIYLYSGYDNCISLQVNYNLTCFNLNNELNQDAIKESFKDVQEVLKKLYVILKGE